ncbi:MAG TPA: LodA/GoxA family CTQ-dependent oxidase [Thermoanaerobaculia bacterium]|nr:LodA/GoxA family CTQ-dependent oxidase [Thermoanaerobaculia bacterium]
MKDNIVRAAIYPAIGIARVGNSPDEFFIGPEIIASEKRPPGFYKDRKGALKRQAARFRIYGLDEEGRVVKELTASDAKITWTVHVANRKAEWFEFDVALDIPQAQPVVRRNANFTGDDRKRLVIDPGPRSISGTDQSSKPEYTFDTGRFLDETVYLGELRTDDAGRLLFLGGYGISKTPFANNPPTTFANNNGWHDDVSDGPVDATVVYKGQSLPVDGAWVVTAPPNYAPDIVSVQTLYDVIFDALNGNYVEPAPKPSFTNDILPLLQQFTQNQWVNAGFYVGFGYAQGFDFHEPELIRRLGTLTKGDIYAEYRRQIFNYFRNPKSQQIEPQRWPWMYGDNMNVPATTANGYFTVTKTIYRYLTQWANGDFIADYDPKQKTKSFDELTPGQQSDMLTKSALWYCLGGPFHPGCEMTWPMRIVGMYSGPFRIRRRSANNPEGTYGPTLDPADFQNGNYFTTPSETMWNGPGDLSRWMAVPWQTDTASCRSGYEPNYDPVIPTFWPAHVPNQVLREQDYEIVIDTKRPREERLEAFNKRASWYRILGKNYLDSIQNMVDRYGDMGVVEARPGVKNDPDFPAEMWVETRPFAPGGGPAKKGVLLERVEAARDAEDIPFDQLLVVGPVGRAARRR